MRTLVIALANFFIAFSFLGCSNMLMPYKDEFRCNKGVGSGYCASMSENYEEIQKNSNSKSPKKQIKEETQNTTIEQSSSCQKCDDTTEAIWLKQRELEKKYGIK